HLAYDLPAKIVQAARLSHRVPARPCPICAHTPRHGHVTHAKLVILFDILQTLVQSVSAFQAHQRGELSFGNSTTNVCGSSGKLPSVWMLSDQLLHRPYLVICALDGDRPTAAVNLRVDPDGEELRVQSALAHSHGVQVAVRQAIVDVQSFDVHALCGVRVHVY